MGIIVFLWYWLVLLFFIKSLKWVLCRVKFLSFRLVNLWNFKNFVKVNNVMVMNFVFIKDLLRFWNNFCKILSVMGSFLEVMCDSFFLVDFRIFWGSVWLVGELKLVILWV